MLDSLPLVEKLYHDILLVEDVPCKSESEEILKSRIKTNLRSVLCDLVILSKVKDD